MPPKNFDRKRAAREETYGSDDGFVEDAPKSKRSKTAGNELKRRDGKATVSEGLQHDDEGNEYWEVNGTVIASPEHSAHPYSALEDTAHRIIEL